MVTGVATGAKWCQQDDLLRSIHPSRCSSSITVYFLIPSVLDVNIDPPVRVLFDETRLLERPSWRYMAISMFISLLHFAKLNDILSSDSGADTDIHHLRMLSSRVWEGTSSATVVCLRLGRVEDS